jgi:3-phenylpropionate/trans-cinnamate dioxygenase ferredoxin subunit
MAKWIKVIAANALANGEHVCIEIENTVIAVFKVEGEFYAIENVCSHDGGEIASGIIENNAIICPRHGARFCLKTGLHMSPPAYEAIASFAVFVQNGDVYIHDNRWD